jgi:hypothetical protein
MARHSSRLLWSQEMPPLVKKKERGELVVSSPTSPDRLVGACQARMEYRKWLPGNRSRSVFSASSARSAVMDRRSSHHGRVSLARRTGGRLRTPNAQIGGTRGVVAWGDSERSADREVVHPWWVLDCAHPTQRERRRRPRCWLLHDGEMVQSCSGLTDVAGVL